MFSIFKGIRFVTSSMKLVPANFWWRCLLRIISLTCPLKVNINCLKDKLTFKYLVAEEDWLQFPPSFSPLGSQHKCGQCQADEPWRDPYDNIIINNIQ